jgi:hypothetical protein
MRLRYENRSWWRPDGWAGKWWFKPMHCRLCAWVTEIDLSSCQAASMILQRCTFHRWPHLANFCMIALHALRRIEDVLLRKIRCIVLSGLIETSRLRIIQPTLTPTPGAHIRFPVWVSFSPLMLTTRHLSKLPTYIESFTGVSIESRRELWDSKGKCIKFHTGNSKGDPCANLKRLHDATRNSKRHTYTSSPNLGICGEFLTRPCMSGRHTASNIWMSLWGTFPCTSNARGIIESSFKCDHLMVKERKGWQNQQYNRYKLATERGSAKSDSHACMQASKAEVSDGRRKCNLDVRMQGPSSQLARRRGS